MTLKVGDRVRFIADNPNGGAGYGRKGQEAVVSGICDYVVHKYGPQVELEPFGDLDFPPNAPVSCLELITEGPVRTVTRREVVEGSYGRLKTLKVSPSGVSYTKAMVSLEARFYSRDDLTEIIDLLAEVRDGLELAGALE